MLRSPIQTLKRYVNQPSGTYDPQDVAKFAALAAEDFHALGLNVTLTPLHTFGPVLEARIGRGSRQLLLMGHMDTVFPHSQAVPFQDLGNGTAIGSGVIDMKGGITVLLHALEDALPHLNLDEYTLCVLLNPDEEIGSIESRPYLEANARQSFAALSFEFAGPDGALICSRKGVTSVRVTCRGIPGHSGTNYLESASAIQALCMQLTRLYALRDDSQSISFNAGVIAGGTAENIVAGEAHCDCEFRYFDESLREPLSQRIRELCVPEPVSGVQTELIFGSSHPALAMSAQSQTLLDRVLEISRRQEIPLRHERNSSAGDISIVGQCGIGVLDGLGLIGSGMHTRDEYAILSSLPERIALTSALLTDLCSH